MYPHVIHPSWAAAPLPIYPPMFPGGPTSLASAIDDRRSAPRLPCRLFARVIEQTPGGPLTWPALLANVSEQGLALEAIVAPSVGTVLELELSDAVGQRYGRIAAQVVHAGPPRLVGQLIGCLVIGPLPGP